MATGALNAQGNGDAIALRWEAPQDARRFRVWAQWRVPEGEALHTYETVVDARQVQLPPSPARWRPLKLSIELQSVCESGAVSPITPLRQRQFDPRAETVCAPVENVRLLHAPERLVWTGDTHERVELSFHGVVDGQLLSRLESIGNSVPWPAPVRRPAVIRAVRACGETQRSRATFLMLP